MSTISKINYHASQYAIRDDLVAAHQRCWERLVNPGTWWTGRERIAIAAEARRAVDCDICAARGKALSPEQPGFEHACANEAMDTPLDLGVVAAIHRIRMDSGRLTRRWFDSVVPTLMSEEHYVELVAIVANIATIDTFCESIGMALHELPEAVPGNPHAKRPVGAKSGLAWVATIAPEDVSDEDPDIYAAKSAAHIHRALSLVPDEVVGFFDLDDVHYLPDAQLRQFEDEPRDITHAQIELLAARMSALNQCVY